MQTLFGHLALRFSKSPENLATESLHYTISQSDAAKSALIALVRSFDERLPERLIFKTQVKGTKGEIPDLVGFDSLGQEQLLIEAKFWAGLTDNQPVGYLSRLPTARGLLLFIAPARRVVTLWHELLQFCSEAKYALLTETKPHPEQRLATFQNGQRLALVSWRSLLEILDLSLNEARDSQCMADLQQLRGLTEKMDDDLSLPFTHEELTGTLGTRVWQLCQLLDKIGERLVQRGITDSTKLVFPEGIRARLFTMNKYQCYVSLNHELWSTEHCPLWLELHCDSKDLPSLEMSVLQVKNRKPRRYWSNDSAVFIGLDIQYGVVLDDVAGRIVEQIREVKQLLDARKIKQ